MLKTRFGKPNHRAFLLLPVKLCQETSYSVVEKECDRGDVDIEVNLSLVVQGVMRKKRGVRGRER